MQLKQINVVGAVIIQDDKILCAQRGPGGSLAGMWEFPGGKLEPGESKPEALVREIAEELECVIEVGDEVATTRHEYDFGVVTLTTFYCTLVDGTPQATEHSSLRWLAPADLDSLEWAPADIPAVELIRGPPAPEGPARAHESTRAILSPAASTSLWANNPS